MLTWKKSTDKSSTTSAAPSAAPGGPAVIYEFSRWTGSRSTAIHPPSPTGVTLKRVKGVLLPDGLRQYAAQDDVLRVRLGDAVFLASSDQEPFIGLVNRLFRDRFRSRNLVEIQWFYKLDDLPNGACPADGKPASNELFLSVYKDINEVDTIIGKCKLGRDADSIAQLAAQSAQPTFFCRRTFPRFAPLNQSLYNRIRWAPLTANTEAATPPPSSDKPPSPAAAAPQSSAHASADATKAKVIATVADPGQMGLSQDSYNAASTLDAVSEAANSRASTPSATEKPTHPPLHGGDTAITGQADEAFSSDNRSESPGDCVHKMSSAITPQHSPERPQSRSSALSPAATTKSAGPDNATLDSPAVSTVTAQLISEAAASASDKYASQAAAQDARAEDTAIKSNTHSLDTSSNSNSNSNSSNSSTTGSPTTVDASSHRTTATSSAPSSITDTACLASATVPGFHSGSAGATAIASPTARSAPPLIAPNGRVDSNNRAQLVFGPSHGPAGALTARHSRIGDQYQAVVPEWPGSTVVTSPPQLRDHRVQKEADTVIQDSWSRAEHLRFLRMMTKYGKDLHSVARGTRSKPPAAVVAHYYDTKVKCRLRYDTLVRAQTDRSLAAVDDVPGLHEIYCTECRATCDTGLVFCAQEDCTSPIMCRECWKRGVRDISKNASRTYTWDICCRNWIALCAGCLRQQLPRPKSPPRPKGESPTVANHHGSDRGQLKRKRSNSSSQLSGIPKIRQSGRKFLVWASRNCDDATQQRMSHALKEFWRGKISKIEALSRMHSVLQHNGQATRKFFGFVQPQAVPQLVNGASP